MSVPGVPGRIRMESVRRRRSCVRRSLREFPRYASHRRACHLERRRDRRRSGVPRPPADAERAGTGEIRDEESEPRLRVVHEGESAARHRRHKGLVRSVAQAGEEVEFRRSRQSLSFGVEEDE